MRRKLGCWGFVPGHHGIQHARGLLRLRRVRAAAARLKSDGVDTTIDLSLAQDGPAIAHQRVLVVVTRREKAESPELFVDRHAAGDVDGLTAHAARLSQALCIEIADDDASGAKQLRAGCGGEADGTSARDVDGRA
jgi:hypothetical protein